MSNPNPSAWFVYVPIGAGHKYADKLAKALNYEYIDYVNGGEWVVAMPYHGAVFHCGDTSNSHPGKHRFIPTNKASTIWVVEHNFFGEATCPYAKDPDRLDFRIIDALEALQLKVKVA